MESVGGRLWRQPPQGDPAGTGGALVGRRIKVLYHGENEYYEGVVRG